MPREYRHIQEYEKEILELKKKGLTNREIGEKLGFTKIQIKAFFCRLHTKERKLVAGVVPKRKGRPPKGYVINEKDKIAELEYTISKKERRIKSLEMENELLRDFLSLAERK